MGSASCLYEEIQKCSIQNEDANFKGKTKPFTHTILGGATFMAGAVEPMMYVGIKVVLKTFSSNSARNRTLKGKSSRHTSPR